MNTLPLHPSSFHRFRAFSVGVLGLTVTALPCFGQDAYNGAQPTKAKDLKGKKITVTDVPKLIGIGYFDATAKGDTPRVVLGVAVMSAFVVLFNRVLWRPLFSFASSRLRLD